MKMKIVRPISRPDKMQIITGIINFVLSGSMQLNDIALSNAVNTNVIGRKMNTDKKAKTANIFDFGERACLILPARLAATNTDIDAHNPTVIKSQSMNCIVGLLGSKPFRVLEVGCAKQPQFGC
jgi:hypothetical protein